MVAVKSRYRSLTLFLAKKRQECDIADFGAIGAPGGTRDDAATRRHIKTRCLASKFDPAKSLPIFQRLSEFRRAYVQEFRTSKYLLELTSSQEGWI